MLAQSLGKFAQLFDEETVYKSLLPMFFKFCYDQVTKVSEAAAPSLVYFLAKFESSP